MRKLYFIILCYFVIYQFLSNLFASYSGATVFEFLKIDTTARPSAIGGAFVGIADDVNAINYNPSGLGLLNENQITFMHNEWFQEVQQQYFAFSHKSGFGLAINYLNYGRIQETRISNTRGIGLENFTNYDFAVNSSYGRKINDKISLGLNLKYIYGKIFRYDTWAISTDLGCVYIIPIEKLTVGVVLQNISTKTKFFDVKEELPLTIKCGLGYKFLDEKVILGLDINQQIDSKKLILNFGAEYKPVKFVILRGGINTRNETDTGLTAGVGFNHFNFAIDYAYSPYGDLGITHKIALTYKFGKEEKEIAKETKLKIEIPEVKISTPTLPTSLEAQKAIEEIEISTPSAVPTETLKTIEGIEIKEEIIQPATETISISTEAEKITTIVATERAINFELNSAEITNFDVLDKLVEFFLQNPYYRIEIIGHTDSTGKKEYNLQLSKRRAENVMKYLIDNGISSDVLTVKGVGDTQPIAPNDTPENRAKNRRVEIILH